MLGLFRRRLHSFGSSACESAHFVTVGTFQLRRVLYRNVRYFTLNHPHPPTPVRLFSVAPQVPRSSQLGRRDSESAFPPLFHWVNLTPGSRTCQPLCSSRLVHIRLSAGVCPARLPPVRRFRPSDPPVHRAPFSEGKRSAMCSL